MVFFNTPFTLHQKTREIKKSVIGPHFIQRYRLLFAPHSTFKVKSLPDSNSNSFIYVRLTAATLNDSKDINILEHTAATYQYFFLQG